MLRLIVAGYGSIAREGERPVSIAEEQFRLQKRTCGGLVETMAFDRIDDEQARMVSHSPDRA